MRRFDRLSGGAGDTRISVQSARDLNEEARCVRHAPQNFREMFHNSNYLNDQINFGVGTWGLIGLDLVCVFSLMCGVGVVCD